MGIIIRETVKSYLVINESSSVESILKENGIHYKKVDIIELEEISEEKFEKDSLELNVII